ELPQEFVAQVDIGEVMNFVGRPLPAAFAQTCSSLEYETPLALPLGAAQVLGIGSRRRRDDRPADVVSLAGCFIDILCRALLRIEAGRGPAGHAAELPSSFVLAGTGLKRRRARSIGMMFADRNQRKPPRYGSRVKRYRSSSGQVSSSREGKVSGFGFTRSL